MENKKQNKVTFIPNGPLMIEGAAMVKGIDGNILEGGEKVFLCRCGRSDNKPFCDGAHKK